MTQLMPSLDDLLVTDEEANNLTYFAFAKSHKAEPALAPTKASVGEMPDVLAGRYRIERLLGAGGMGAVYRARDLLSEQFGDPDPYIALKILSEEFAESPDASALLYSEFALTRRLRHNNVLRLHSFEVDTDCQRAFITMELMRGLTLDKLLCERPLGLPWKELRDIALPLLDALAFAHARGVLHGDMKPSNVMLSEEGVRLFDFGLGQAEEGILPGLPHLSRNRFNAWTPATPPPNCSKANRCRPARMSTAWPAYSTNWRAANTRSAACPRPKPATATSNASCTPPGISRNTAGQPCERRWHSMRQIERSLPPNCVTLWAPHRLGCNVCDVGRNG